MTTTKMRTCVFAWAAILSVFACACDSVPTHADSAYNYIVYVDPWGFRGADYRIADEYDATIYRVSSMVFDGDLTKQAQGRGFEILNVAWEDTGRALGSALGPNISDLTLQVRRSYASGAVSDTLMPVIRYPNFTDRTADVPANRFFLRVGNQQSGKALTTVSLLSYLKDIRRYASAPDSMSGSDSGAGEKLDLSAPRDAHFLVSAQAVLLPIPKTGKTEFNPVVFNYQSAPGSPAVLAILATREGTSARVIENSPEDATVQGWGQELYFNDEGHRASFSAERRSDVAARIAAQGGPKTEADRSALGKGADVLALIQVPLIHEQRGALGGVYSGGAGSGSSSDSGYGYEFSDDPLSAGGFGPNDAVIRVRPGPVRSDVERAVLGHGPRLGPFLEGYGGRLVRDQRFPIRITVQFYKATSSGVLEPKDFDAITRNINSAYEHADYVGSLVLPESDQARPTEWQKIPNEWFPW